MLQFSDSLRHLRFGALFFSTAFALILKVGIAFRFLHKMISEILQTFTSEYFYIYSGFLEYLSHTFSIAVCFICYSLEFRCESYRPLCCFFNIRMLLKLSHRFYWHWYSFHFVSDLSLPDRIHSTIFQLKLNCPFFRVPPFFYCPSSGDVTLFDSFRLSVFWGTVYSATLNSSLLTLHSCLSRRDKHIIEVRLHSYPRDLPREVILPHVDMVVEAGERHVRRSAGQREPHLVVLEP